MKAKAAKISNDAESSTGKEKDKIIDHTVSGCSKTAHSNDKKNHNKVTAII